MIEYHVLGAVTVSRDGLDLAVPTRMVRRLLAILLAQAGTRVSADSLIEHLWPERPPASARRTLQVYVSRLRGLQLPDIHVTSEAGGYILRPLPGELDSEMFARLLAQSRQAHARGELAEALAAVRDALGLWRGPAYDGFRDLPSVSAEAHRLEQLRLSAFEYSTDLLLEVGRTGEALSGLLPMIEQNPYRERLRAQQMLALYRSGQRVEALECYRQMYDLFARELGIQPGRPVAELHQAILRGDPVLAVPEDGAAAQDFVPAAGTGPAPPAQLPAALLGFAGRHREIVTLVDTLRRAGPRTAGLVIASISGMPGVGKTALATHVAHRVADAFPDGQLYTNLRGYDAGPPRPAAQVLQAFLVALGEPAAELPGGVEELAAIYRTRLSGRRVLVFLDNVRDAAQVRPLLPGTSGSAVLVTGRSSLADLVASDGAVLCPLEVLDDDAAAELLTARLGTAAPPDQLAEIIDLCGRLPLALSIAAARAASLPLTVVAAGLRQADARLSALDLGVGTSSVRAVFTWSYDKLSVEAARLFRSLGWHPAGDIDAWSAASASGLPPDRVQGLLGELTENRLLEDAGDGQFTIHDLLHTYAQEMVSRDSVGQGRAARRRLDDHLLHSAHHAARLTQPHRRMVTLDEPAAGAVPVPLASRAAAGEWLRRRQGLLLRALQDAHDQGRYMFVWRLAWCLTEFLHRFGYSHDWLAAQQLALSAAEHLGDRCFIATANRNLARAAMFLARFDQARELLERALEIATADGVASSRAITLMALTELAELTDEHAAGLRYARAALAAYDEAGDRIGRSYAVLGLAFQHGSIGEHELALRYSSEAIADFLERGDEVALPHAYEARAAAYRVSGDFQASIEWYERARVAMRTLGHRAEEAAVLESLGDVHTMAGHDARAIHAWRQSLDIREMLSDPKAAGVRDRITAAVRRQAGPVPESTATRPGQR